MAKGQTAIDMGVRRCAKTHLGVKGPDAGRWGLGLHRLGKLGPQESGGLIVKLGQAIHRGGRIAEFLGREGSEIRSSGITTRASSECCI